MRLLNNTTAVDMETLALWLYPPNPNPNPSIQQFNHRNLLLFLNYLTLKNFYIRIWEKRLIGMSVSKFDLFYLLVFLFN